jgi:hypothetical protein
MAAKAPPVAASPYSYADIADLASRAPTVAVARIKRISAVRADLATNLPAGTKRYYVEADVQSLIRGEAALARRIAFVIDLPDERNAAKAIKGKTFILFGRTGGKPDRMQLVSSNALLPLTPATEAKVKSITAELLKPDAPPAIAGIGNAFHVKGTVAGEGETQIFLLTDGGQPVSLSIVRRPGMAPQFGVALGEVVDEAAAIPPSDTLLWYRLACVLPDALPGSAVAKLEPRTPRLHEPTIAPSWTNWAPAPAQDRPSLAMVPHRAKGLPRADPGVESGHECREPLANCHSRPGHRRRGSHSPAPGKWRAHRAPRRASHRNRRDLRA